MRRFTFLFVSMIIFLICGSVYAAGPNVMRYKIESKGGPTTAFWMFSDAQHVFQSGDVLEYDVYLKNRKPGAGGIDITTKQASRLRDFKQKDQSGIEAVPKAELSKVAYGIWYHRKIAIPRDLIGDETSEWLVTTDGIYDTGEFIESAYNNVCITNKGRMVLSVYNGNKLSMNQVNFANEITLESAVLISSPFNDKIRTTLDWFNSFLPSNKYIGMHAEAYDFQKKQWVSACPTIQPLKSMVYKPWKAAFFRKDDMQDFYGELFTYDLTTLRLHTETMPSRSPHEMETHPVWDARPDRVRVFVQTSNGYQNWFTDKTVVYDWQPTCLVRLKTGSAQWKIGVEQSAGENWSIGRAMAPVSGTTDWQFRGTVNTYMADNYNQLSDGTAPLIQISINDHVTVTRIKNFNSVYDGEAEGWKAEPEFKHFDEAFSINQHMNDNGARERFIFARKGENYYGVVRWDCSEYRDGKWVVTNRATGLKQMTAENGFSFSGMYDRVRNDKWIQPKELDMNVVNPSGVPAVLSGNISITMRNDGLKTWKTDETALYARLMDSTWKPVEGSETKLYAVNQDVDTLTQHKVNVEIPKAWKSGTYFLVLEMRDGDTWFSKKGSIPFVKKVEIKARK
ncbi:MAG: hypothetical protein ACYC27_01840 [Armatimonadota bacterium]